jgi:hypothetical protein
MRTLLIYILTIITVNGFAQNESKMVELNVIVASAKNKKILKNVRVILDQDSLNQIKANKKNEFELAVQKNKEIAITFMAKGYVSKTILVNTFTVSNIKSCKLFEIELLLIVKKKRLNYDLLNFPIVEIYYCKQAKKVKYNNAYNTKMKTKYRNFLQKINNDQLAVFN